MGPWSIRPSTTVIGVPYQPAAVQVTFDGAVYTRHAQLCFFFGRPLRPLLAQQKELLEGWIPIVVYRLAGRSDRRVTAAVAKMHCEKYREGNHYVK